MNATNTSTRTAAQVTAELRQVGLVPVGIVDPTKTTHQVHPKVGPGENDTFNSYRGTTIDEDDHLYADF